MVKSGSPSSRYAELLDAAYAYALEQGLSEMSLRPLAAAIGSSPRVLLYLFGSKDGLVRALLARARADEIAALPVADGSLPEVAALVWAWLRADTHAPLLRLWVQAYGRSLTEPTGPWAEFAQSTVIDWLALLGRAQPATVRRTAAGRAERTAVLAVLRGGLLDLLATGERARVDRAVAQALTGLAASRDAAARSASAPR